METINKIQDFLKISNGNGCGYGYGNGNGCGCGCGNGNGGIKSINGMAVYRIDGVQTVITRIRGNIAKGYILQNNVYLKPCFVVKQNDLFAHGYTLHEAQQSLSEKLFAGMSVDERIDAFIKEFPGLDNPYPNEILFVWHNKLTGSCLPGRNAFVANHNIDMSGSTTIREFIALTENDYGGDVIRQLKIRLEAAE